MPGSFDLDGGYSTPQAQPALPVGVYAYTAGAGYQYLPNLFPVRIDRREGGQPSQAVFAYIQDDAFDATFGWPSRFEEILPLNAPFNWYVAGIDTRVVVLSQNPDGSPWVLWDGFMSAPEAAVDGGDGVHDRGSEHVTVTGVGVEARLWDNPIFGSVHRNSDSIGLYKTDASADKVTEMRCRFNPSNGRGAFDRNRTPVGYSTLNPATGLQYPVFCDPDSAGVRNPAPAHWHVGTGVRYLLATKNGRQTYVQNPPLLGLDTLLQAYLPLPGFSTLNPADPSTYRVAPVRIEDYDASNQRLPDAVGTLVRQCGFLYKFWLSTTAIGTPQTTLYFYRRDEFASQAPKILYLDQEGVQLNLAANNVTDLHLRMDANAIVNAFHVETAQRRYEISWILNPLYQPDPADATNRGPFRLAALVGATATQARKYRLYGADELGDGHWTQFGTWDTTTPADFSAALPKISGVPGAAVVRYRPGSRTLIATDADGRPFHADLSISFDYGGNWGAPWDGATGTWQSIKFGWRLLPDRLGIEVTTDSPEEWQTGGAASQPTGVNPAAAAIDAIRGITWWANPPAGAPVNSNMPVLRLTTVIESDWRMHAHASKRIASPTTFTRGRIADRRDMMKFEAIGPSSIYYQAAGGVPAGTTPIRKRDDYQAATDLAATLRAAHEFPTLSGTVTIPWITDYYDIGDRIALIQGRNASLNTNIGASQGEGPTYAWVVARTMSFDGGQSTTLTLSDEAAIPRRGFRRGRRRTGPARPRRPQRLKGRNP